MKQERRRHALAALGTVVLAATIAVGTAHQAFAAAPPWEPDTNGLGTLTFYDATGAVKTSGLLNAQPFVKYVLASAPGRGGDTKATLRGATPNSSQSTGDWTVYAMSGSTAYPNSGAAAPLNSATNPLVTLAGTDPSLQNLIDAQPNVDTTTGYPNVYQLRVETSGPGQPPSGSYFTADVLVDTGAGTWTQVYPEPPATTGTVTTLDAAPASPQLLGTSVTLTATETAADTTHPAGSVQFKDGATNLGAPVAVNGSGVATYTSTSFAVGTHSFTAVFAPTDTGTYAGSTSPAAPYTIDALATTTSLAASPPTSALQDAAITLTATVAPGAAPGSVQFKDNGSNLGTAVTVSSGSAAKTVSFPTVASHSFTAVFTPSSPDYAASTSSAVPYDVTAAPPAWRPYQAGAHRVGLAESCLASLKYATSLAYSWADNGVTIAGATAAAYLVPETLYGHVVTCHVTATGPGGVASGTSAGFTIGVGPALVPQLIHRPYLFQGTSRTTARRNTYEYVNHGTWNPAATTYTYQWYLGTTKLTGATGVRILAKSTWVGKVLYCVVTARRGTAWTPGVFKTAGVKVV